MSHNSNGGYPPGDNYLNRTKGFLSWITTLDHKRIGMMYLASVLFFFVGGFFAILLRTELLTPKQSVQMPQPTVDAKGNSVTFPEQFIFTKDQYNKLFTLHGAIMVFLVIIPSIPASLGNFILPIMLGEGCRVPTAQFVELLPLYCRHGLLPDHASGGTTGYRVDLLHSLQLHFRHRHQHQCDHGYHGRLHPWVQLDLHRHQLPRDHPLDASSWYDLVPHALVPLARSMPLRSFRCWLLPYLVLPC